MNSRRVRPLPFHCPGADACKEITPKHQLVLFVHVLVFKHQHAKIHARCKFNTQSGASIYVVAGRESYTTSTPPHVESIRTPQCPCCRGAAAALAHPKATCSMRSILHWSTTRLRLCFVAHCTGKHACPEETKENQLEEALEIFRKE